jgi:hypothetical protein
MWLWARRPLRRPESHEVNQVLLCGPVFHQEALHTARCGGNHFLTSNSYLGQWKSCSWCMWPKVHIMDASICSTCISQVEGVYMDPIRVRVHHEANLWQAQRNLVGTNNCKWADDLAWLPMTLRYQLFGSESQEGHLAFAHKLNTFHSIMGLCSSLWCF